MLTTNRKRVGYLIIALAIILLIVLIFLFFRSGEDSPFRDIFKRDKDSVLEEDKRKQEFDEMVAEREKDKVYSFDAEYEAGREWEDHDFKQVARAFAGRFGSFSSHSDYGNVEDLRSMMSVKMRDWADNYVNNLRAERGEGADYYGITTVVLIEPEMVNMEKSSGVEVMVTTQREENLVSGDNRVYEQKILIAFVKEGGEWKVDGAFWQ